MTICYCFDRKGCPGPQPGRANKNSCQAVGCTQGCMGTRRGVEEGGRGALPVAMNFALHNLGSEIEEGVKEGVWRVP